MKFSPAPVGKLLLATLIFNLLTIKTYTQSTYHIPAEIATIREAVQLAQNGDTLFIYSDVYTDSVQIFNKELVIIGEGPTAPEFAPSENQAMAFDVKNAKVQFWNLFFTNYDLQTPPPNIAIKAYDSDLIVKDCRFEQLFTPISLMTGNLEVSHSTFLRTRGGHAITLNLGTFEIHNNLIAQGEYQGIFINRSHGHLFNNTLVGTSTTQHFGIIINSDSISQIFNNVITNFGIGLVNLASDSMELNALHIHHNNVYETAAPYRYEYNESLNLPIYYGDLVPFPGNGEIQAPALFINPDEGNYTLAEGSPCVDAGSNDFPAPVQFDLAGAERVVGIATDIGAFEWQLPLNTQAATPVNTMNIYPQPARDWVTIEFGEVVRGELQLLTSDGRLVRSFNLQEADSLRLDFTLAAGLYFLRFLGEEGICTQKLMVR